ncbi:MAG: hypothetical protein ACR2MQ_07300, partial [Gemmatimonadaceae bacterium]
MSPVFLLVALLAATLRIAPAAPEPRLRVADRLVAEVFAPMPDARFMLVGPDGAAYVSQFAA